MKFGIAGIATLVIGCGSESSPPPTNAARLSHAERAAQKQLLKDRAAADAAEARRLTERLHESKRSEASPEEDDAHATRERPGRPDIRQRAIPFPAKRRAEMAAYAKRHYGLSTFELRAPRVIVEHYTVTETAEGAFDIFARDVPDSELHELPGTCAHFVIDRDGTIYLA